MALYCLQYWRQYERRCWGTQMGKVLLCSCGLLIGFCLASLGTGSLTRWAFGLIQQGSSVPMNLRLSARKVYHLPLSYSSSPIKSHPVSTRIYVTCVFMITSIWLCECKQRRLKSVGFQIFQTVWLKAVAFYSNLVIEVVCMPLFCSLNPILLPWVGLKIALKLQLGPSVHSYSGLVVWQHISLIIMTVTAILELWIWLRKCPSDAVNWCCIIHLLCKFSKITVTLAGSSLPAPSLPMFSSGLEIVLLQ